MFVSPEHYESLEAQILSLQPNENEAVMLLFGEEHLPDVPALLATLADHGIQVFGGVFPGLIYADRRTASGCIIKKFTTLLRPFCTTGIADCRFDGIETLHQAQFNGKGTAIVLVDGLTPNIYRFLENLNDILGEKCHFIGGGAGSISLVQQPCVFCNRSFVSDAAVVCVIHHQINLGVRHGWEQLAGPLVATQTDGNTIYQLNWDKATDIYNRIVQEDCGKALTSENFGSIAQGYPFGILREKQDDIVRDPLRMGPDGEIICIGEVPANTVLHILKGRPEALLQAARQAMLDCNNGSDAPIVAEGTFVVDCITRTLFLDDQFAEEMDIIRKRLVVDEESREPFGVLSLGEISSFGDGLLELFNKTIVIGVIS